MDRPEKEMAIDASFSQFPQATTQPNDGEHANQRCISTSYSIFTGSAFVPKEVNFLPGKCRFS
jgi:hypothetical protein